MSHKLLEKELFQINKWSGPKLSGKVTQVIGSLIESTDVETFVGELCLIKNRNSQLIPSQVVGFKEKKVLLMAFGEVIYIGPGAEVYPTGEVHQIKVGRCLCGRILDGLGHPIDGKGALEAEHYYPVMTSSPHPLSRLPIQTPLFTGIKAIDAICTLGRGQRMGIFSGPGAGKSTLMGMIAREVEADINVIALIGERGREVREFIERELPKSCLAKSVIVVVTSDQAALLKSKGAHVATTIAEYFRDLGKDVVLMMDSISRYAMALREIGLAIREPSATKGYPPSVFSALPKLLERAGNNHKGSITGIYTVLSEEDALGDPIADQLRSLLDGHLYLSRELADAHHYPAIDILKSLSRVMTHIVSKKQLVVAGKLRNLLNSYIQAQDLIQVGAYMAGTNRSVDEAIIKIGAIQQFLQQGPSSPSSYEETMTLLENIFMPMEAV